MHECEHEQHAQMHKWEHTHSLANMNEV